MFRSAIRLVRFWFFVLSLGLILASCKNVPTTAPTASPAELSGESLPSPTPILTPTLAPTQVQAPRKVVLLGEEDQAGELPYAGIFNLLQELADQDNLILESIGDLGPSGLADDVAIVVALPPDPGLAELAAARRDVQFLAVGIPGLQPADNLSTIEDKAVTPDVEGFVAGYLAAVISKEYRTGMIGVGDTDQGNLARQGFVNGITYYCGLCRSPYPPFYTYPILVDLPSSATAAEAQAAAEAIISQAVNTVFVYPGAGDQAMLERLAQAGVHIIAGIEPPPVLRANWVATVRADPLAAVHAAWPELIGEQSGIERSLEITLANRNESLFSTGRQQLVDEFLADLQDGFIITGVSE